MRVLLTLRWVPDWSWLVLLLMAVGLVVRSWRTLLVWGLRLRLMVRVVCRRLVLMRRMVILGRIALRRILLLVLFWRVIRVMIMLRLIGLLM